MKGSSLIRTTGRLGGLGMRHLIAGGVTVGALCIGWTVTYFALLLWAVVTGNGTGGPLAYPAGLLFFFMAGVVASAGFLFPSTALAEWFARRRGFPILTQIPISLAILSLLCLVLSCVACGAKGQASFRCVSTGFGILFAANLLPLGFYWWVAQSGPILNSVFHRLFPGFRS